MTLCDLLLELLSRRPRTLLHRRSSSLVSVRCRLRRSLGSLEGLHLTELVGRQSPARSTGGGSGPLSESGQMGSLLLRSWGRAVGRLLRGRSSSSLANTRCGHVRCRGVRCSLRVRRLLSGGGRSGNVRDLLLRGERIRNLQYERSGRKENRAKLTLCCPPVLACMARYIACCLACCSCSSRSWYARSRSNLAWLSSCGVPGRDETKAWCDSWAVRTRRGSPLTGE